MKLLSTLSSEYDKVKRLVVKVWNGKSRTFTAEEVSSYGVDSRPIKGMVALYTTSEVDGAEVIVGYLNKNRIAELGESRMFSTDDSGIVKFNIWLRNSGELLMGTSSNPSEYNKHAVEHEALKTEFNKLKKTVNDHIQDYNTHTHPYANVTTPSTTSVTTSLSTPDTSNIDNAKIDKIKYKI